MLDVIVNEVGKYSPMAGKLEAKADKQFEWLDVLAVIQVRDAPRDANMLRALTCKDEFTSNLRWSSAILQASTSNSALTLSAPAKNSPALQENIRAKRQN